MKKVHAYRKQHKKNPHLGSAYTFVGIIEKRDIKKIKSGLKAHGIGNIKITADHVDGDKKQRELYVGRAYDAGQIRLLVTAILRGR